MRAVLFLLPVLVGVSPAAAQSFRGHDTKAPISYAADRTEASLRDDRAIFSGNVVVRQGDMSLNAARITVAFADSKAKTSINRVDAAGGVYVRRGTDSARGSFAVYDPIRKLITVIGDVTLTQAGNVARGARLVIDLDSGRAMLSGSSAANQGGGNRVSGTFTVPDRTK